MTSTKNYIACVSVALEPNPPADATVEKCSECRCAVWLSATDKKRVPDVVVLCDPCAVELSKEVQAVVVLPPGVGS